MSPASHSTLSGRGPRNEGGVRIQYEGDGEEVLPRDRELPRVRCVERGGVCKCNLGTGGKEGKSLEVM